MSRARGGVAGLSSVLSAALHVLESCRGCKAVASPRIADLADLVGDDRQRSSLMAAIILYELAQDGFTPPLACCRSDCMWASARRGGGGRSQEGSSNLSPKLKLALQSSDLDEVRRHGSHSCCRRIISTIGAGAAAHSPADSGRRNPPPPNMCSVPRYWFKSELCEPKPVFGLLPPLLQMLGLVIFLVRVGWG